MKTKSFVSMASTTVYAAIPAVAIAAAGIYSFARHSKANVIFYFIYIFGWWVGFQSRNRYEFYNEVGCLLLISWWFFFLTCSGNRRRGDSVVDREYAGETKRKGEGHTTATKGGAAVRWVELFRNLGGILAFTFYRIRCCCELEIGASCR